MNFCSSERITQVDHQIALSNDTSVGVSSAALSSTFTGVCRPLPDEHGHRRGTTSKALCLGLDFNLRRLDITAQKLQHLAEVRPGYHPPHKVGGDLLPGPDFLSQINQPVARWPAARKVDSLRFQFSKQAFVHPKTSGCQ